MVVPFGPGDEGTDGRGTDRNREHEQDESTAILPRELDRDQHHGRDAHRRDDRDSGRDREPTELEIALGDRDRARHEEDADDRGGDGRQDRAGPTRSPEGIALPRNRPEHDHRDRRRHRELSKVEGELGRPLAADDRERGRRPHELSKEKSARRKQVEPEDEPDLAERDRLRLPSKLNVDDVGLGEVEEQRQRPPRQRAGDDRRRVEAAQNLAPESDARREQAGIVEPDPSTAGGARPGSCLSPGRRVVHVRLPAVAADGEARCGKRLR